MLLSRYASGVVRKQQPENSFTFLWITLKDLHALLVQLGGMSNTVSFAYELAALAHKLAPVAVRAPEAYNLTPSK